MINPLHRLLEPFGETRRTNDPCATFVTLVIVDQGGTPVSRIITVRETTDAGLIASVSTTSPKVAQLVADKWEVLCFWPSLMAQCRLRGHAHIQHNEATAANWNMRPKTSRLVDTYHASMRPQSSPIIISSINSSGFSEGRPTFIVIQLSLAGH